MKKLLLSTLCGILMATGVAAAAPSVNGPTGMINDPSADVLRAGQVSLGYYHLKSGGVGVFNTHLADNLEVGVSGFRYDNQNNKTYLNAKFALAPETILTPGLAIGVMDAASTDKRSLYTVASKALPFGFRVHVGTGNGRFGGVFAGIEKTVNPISVISGNNVFPSTTLIAEYDGRTMNYGARMSVIPGLKLDAGWRGHSTYFGMSFTSF